MEGLGAWSWTQQWFAVCLLRKMTPNGLIHAKPCANNTARLSSSTHLVTHVRPPKPMPVRYMYNQSSVSNTRLRARAGDNSNPQPDLVSRSRKQHHPPTLSPLTPESLPKTKW
jgi:hypothetical protein